MSKRVMVEYARRNFPYSTHYDWISCYPEVSNDPTCDSESPHQNAQVTYSGVPKRNYFLRIPR